MDIENTETESDEEDNEEPDEMEQEDEELTSFIPASSGDVL